MYCCAPVVNPLFGKAIPALPPRMRDRFSWDPAAPEWTKLLLLPVVRVRALGPGPSPENGGNEEGESTSCMMMQRLRADPGECASYSGVWKENGDCVHE